MKLIVSVENIDYNFELLELSGSSLPTKTYGNASRKFESHLTLALHNKINDMSFLYRLLDTLTQKFWHGLIIHHKDANNPSLTDYRLRLPEDGEKGTYIIEIGYKVDMPANKIDDYDWSIENENNNADTN